MPVAPGVGPGIGPGLKRLKILECTLGQAPACIGARFFSANLQCRMNQKRPAASDWVTKMLAVLKTGNTAAAIAQIKATTSSKDLRQLHAALEKAQLLKQLAAVDAAISDQLQALASPRLSRSP